MQARSGETQKIEHKSQQIDIVPIMLLCNSCSMFLEQRLHWLLPTWQLVVQPVTNCASQHFLLRWAPAANRRPVPGGDLRLGEGTPASLPRIRGLR